MTAPMANSAPKVSVIIPSYNTAHLIATCLESVFAQTYTDFEAMVVNDGSPDTPELEKVLAPYMSRIVYIKQENKRAAGARNNAIRQARGEFVAFLDSDDSWVPTHLAWQMEMIAGDPSLDFVYANGLMVSPDREQEFMESCPSRGEATFEALIMERCQISVSTVVARKRCLVEAGLFDEKLPRCDDYDMWVRTAFHGAKIGYRTTVQARLLVGRPGCLSESNAKMTEAYWNILEKLKTTLPLNDAQRAVVNQRAGEIRALYLVAMGKGQIAAKQFDKARESLSEANQRLHNYKLSLAVFGLSIAPELTGKLLTSWARMQDGKFA
jgi:glycosyltransferase involved in cell wall biosynthesis